MPFPPVTHIPELTDAQFAQLGHTLERRIVLEKQLAQCHWLRPVKGAHLGWHFLLLLVDCLNYFFIEIKFKLLIMAVRLILSHL
jgi:hypothetical protein